MSPTLIAPNEKPLTIFGELITGPADQDSAAWIGTGATMDGETIRDFKW
jgi:hypothetical protein